MSEPAASPKPGCWPIALIILGALISLVSGLCVGGGVIGTIMDLTEQAAPVWNILQTVILYLLVSGLFLAGGIALIVWGVRIQRRR